MHLPNLASTSVPIAWPNVRSLMALANRLSFTSASVCIHCFFMFRHCLTLITLFRCTTSFSIRPYQSVQFYCNIVYGCTPCCDISSHTNSYYPLMSSLSVSVCSSTSILISKTRLFYPCLLHVVNLMFV